MGVEGGQAFHWLRIMAPPLQRCWISGSYSHESPKGIASKETDLQGI